LNDIIRFGYYIASTHSLLAARMKSLLAN